MNNGSDPEPIDTRIRDAIRKIVAAEALSLQKEAEFREAKKAMTAANMALHAANDELGELIDAEKGHVRDEAAE